MSETSAPAHRLVFAVAWTSALALSSACGGSSPPAESPPAAAAPSIALDANGRERARQVLEVEGDPNGLWWDDTAQKLYVSDDHGNRILRWSDVEGFATWRALPAEASKVGLGQLVFTVDGTLVATRFGHGNLGQVLFVPATGEPQSVPGLDPARRRIGLTVTREGRLFDCWFVKTDNGRTGGVSELSLSGKETDVMSGLKKPIGVLASGDRLFVSDQDAGQILSAPLTDLAASEVFVSVEGPDLLALGPDGSFFAGSTSGKLYQISAAGSASVFESGFQQVRGVAYDPTHRRVFIADHDGNDKDGIHHLLHVLPLPR